MSHGKPIVRVSEAHVRTERLAEFSTALGRLVAGFPAQYEGLISHQVLGDLDDPTRVQYISRWRDVQALTEFAGPGWRTNPVTFPDEDRMLRSPLTLRHFQSTEPANVEPAVVPDL